MPAAVASWWWKNAFLILMVGATGTSKEHDAGVDDRVAQPEMTATSSHRGPDRFLSYQPRRSMSTSRVGANAEPADGAEERAAQRRLHPHREIRTARP